MREGTIYLNWTDLVQIFSQRGATDNIDLNNTWFTPYLEDHPIKNPRQRLSVAPENNNNTFTLSQSKPHIHEDLT